MEHALNFRTLKGQVDYYKAYNETLKLWDIEYTFTYVDTKFGKTHVIMCGRDDKPPLVLLHASNCSSTIWYPNVKALSEYFKIYAVDIITEPSKSLLLMKPKKVEECTEWLNETLDMLKLNQVFLVGLSIGGWNSTNYAINYPNRIKKLILMSPVQTFAGMHKTYFYRIIKLGFCPTRKVVEDYIGWGCKAEHDLPDSVIEQFRIATINLSSKGSVFPKLIKKQNLKKLNIPVMVLLGENETMKSLMLWDAIFIPKINL